MSRCFPFPPPGYDKKVRTNDVDLLKKEKHKEKKHKKEKKDKEKREGKEKKEKERTDGKHKEKKDKKDKQRDKSKDRDKEKDRDKDKAGTSGEKKLGVQYEAQNENPFNKGNGKENNFISSDGKKLSAQFMGYNGFVQNGHIVEETKNHKLVQELGRRIRDEGVGPQMAEKFTSTVQRDDSREKLKQNSHLDQIDDSKLVQELGKRIKNEVSGAGASQTVEKHSGLDKKKNEVVRSVALDISNSFDAKEKNSEKRGDARNIDAQGSLCEPKYGGNLVVQKPSVLAQSGDARNIDAQGSLSEPRHGGNSMVKKLSGLAQRKTEGMPISEDKKIEKKLGSQERSKDKENGNKQGDKRKDKDGEKDRKSQEKDRSKEKKKKKEEKAKEKAEQKSVMQDKNEKNKHDHLAKSLDPHSNSKNIVGGNERHLKRKEPEINGFLHATEDRAHKLPRPVLSHALTENGKVLEVCQNSTKSILDSPGEVVSKLREVNGSAEAPLISSSEAKQPSRTVQAEQVAVAPSRSQHPDTVYLSQILTIPKVDEWSEFDDQEWLYSDDKERSKKPKVDPCLDTDTAQIHPSIFGCRFGTLGRPELRGKAALDVKVREVHGVFEW